MSIRRLLTASLTLVLSLSMLVPAGTSGFAQDDLEPPEIMPSETRTAPSIDDALVAQLASASAADAVITTWSRAELGIVDSLGIAATKLRYLPMAFATITSAQLDALRAAPEVRSVWSNEAMSIQMAESTWITKARETWSTMGVTGKGIELAVIDTGIDGLHADSDNLVEFCESQNSATSTSATVFCSPFNVASGNAGPAGPFNDARRDATDDQGHGSHVSGTMAGSGDASGGRANVRSVIGMAPDAKLRVYSSNVGLSLLAFQILSSFDDIAYKKANGLNDVVAINNSWGGGTGSSYDPNDPFNVAIAENYKIGVLSVFSAGNSGPEHNTLGRQCVNPFVVCVAANQKPDQVAMFSSRGRPSEPTDTNRDGAITAADVQPDNHDRRLGQALSVGLYRPALTAPGVAIYSINANAAGCREGVGTNTDCYVPLQGTSMSGPHVAGATALIAQAYRDKYGRLPSPAQITEYLERGANKNKLPGWEAEEQGAGRLNVLESVKLAQAGAKRGGKLVLGYPTPPALTKLSLPTLNGCTRALSWTTGIGYGQHTIEVPENAERLRMNVSWNVTGENLYVRLWRPGVNPDATAPGESRVYPDQDFANLLYTQNIVAGVGVPLRSRFVDVRAPEAGTWTLRVYSRTEVAPETPCGGTNYRVEKLELFTVGAQPTVAIASPSDGGLVSGTVTVSGTATHPTAWDGVTNWQVPGTAVPSALAGTTFYMHGSAHDGYSGDGQSDFASGKLPFLATTAVGDTTRATWTTSPFLTTDTAPSPTDPSWKLALTEPSIVEGRARVSWWASCNGCTFGADWVITIFADGTNAFSKRVSAVPGAPLLPARLTVDLDLPRISASSSLVVMIDPVYIDAQTLTTFYYDASGQCETLVTSPAANAPEQSLACDSYVLLPITAASAAGAVGPNPPTALRVTEQIGQVTVSWQGTDGATAYEVHRSTDPAFVPGRKTLRGTVTTTSLVADGKPNLTYYYRVVALAGSARGKPSLVAYGASRQPTEPEHEVRVRVDRLYGPRYWEFAAINDQGTTWSLPWNAGELSAGPHTIAAQSIAQGVRSPGVTITVTR